MVEEDILVRCGQCGAKNRVPASRVKDRPVCGKCKTPLRMSAAYPKHAIDIDERSFASEALGFPGPVVAFFWAPWCGHCLRMMPLFDELAVQYAGKIKFVKLNMDKTPNLAAQYNIQSVPNLLMIKNGRVANQLLGALPRDQLIYHLNALL